MSTLVAHAADLLPALVAMTLALMSPGPNVLAVIGTSMGRSRASGTALALGVATGTFVWATAATLGLTLLLSAYAGALTAIRIVGGAYLVYLGIRSLRSALRPGSTDVPAGGAARPMRAYFRRGLVVQLTNPKAALAMTAIVTLGIGDDAPASVAVALVVGITALSGLGHCAYALVFSTPAIAAGYARARRGIDAALGAFFVAAGIGLIVGRD